jgi:AcrR family transcriptional regulator
VPTSPTRGDRPLRRDAQANRARILEAASAIFTAQGIEAPLDEIARQAGVGTGTFYRHFPDRDHLLDALFDERVQRYDELMTQACDAEDAWEGLVWLLDTGFALQAEDRGLKEILVARARGTGHVPGPSEETVRAINALLERAKAQGALRADVEMTDMALVSAAVHGVIDLTGAVAPEAWRRILQILLDGLRADRDAATPLPHAALPPDQMRAAIDERHASRRAQREG